jgi:hypothetical protein
MPTPQHPGPRDVPNYNSDTQAPTRHIRWSTTSGLDWPGGIIGPGSFVYATDTSDAVPPMAAAAAEARKTRAMNEALAALQRLPAWMRAKPGFTRDEFHMQAGSMRLSGLPATSIVPVYEEVMYELFANWYFHLNQTYGTSSVTRNATLLIQCEGYRSILAHPYVVGSPIPEAAVRQFVAGEVKNNGRSLTYSALADLEIMVNHTLGFLRMCVSCSAADYYRAEGNRVWARSEERGMRPIPEDIARALLDMGEFWGNREAARLLWGKNIALAGICSAHWGSPSCPLCRVGRNPEISATISFDVLRHILTYVRSNEEGICGPCAALNLGEKAAKLPGSVVRTLLKKQKPFRLDPFFNLKAV